MNEFGRMFLTTYQRMHPQELEQMSNPQQYFTDLGEQAEGRIEIRADQIADSQPQKEDYLAEVARIQQAQQSAREEVVRQMLQELAPEHTAL